MSENQIFEDGAEEYDKWFDEHKFAYESEILALGTLIPKNSTGLEVGVGTGRFAAPFGIQIGVEPARAMADIARKRGITVYEAKAEELPFDNDSFDFILMTTTICFLQNPMPALQESRRVIKSGGNIIIGMIDSDSFLGKAYESKKKDSKFYKYAHFYSVNQVLVWLRELGYGHIRICQTIFKNPEKITAIEPVKDGYGRGGFVVISAQKDE
ncbi:Ubiquinone/menaquinone biosynthesis C-methyltransferase UbiE [ANME-1 cluster archaeon GoMg2]|nr:Ubiquinone/menaquinone biosynthesis C-methyltransferase UbiE [ANME-1 cluster archaeon GoMg2]